MKYLAMILALVFSSLALAQVAVPDVEISKGILDLILGYKVLGPIGIGSGVIVLLVNVLKSDFFGNLFKNLNPLIKRLIITVLGVIYGVLFQVQSGIGWGNAIVTGLLASGGAVAIWEAVKPLIEKK